MPAPSKLTDEARLLVIGALRGGADMALAAQAANVSRRTLFNWQEKHADLAEEIAEAKAIADDTVEQRLFDMTSDNVTACIFWLKNRRNATWRDRWDAPMSEREVIVVEPPRRVGDDEDR